MRIRTSDVIQLACINTYYVIYHYVWSSKSTARYNIPSREKPWVNSGMTRPVFESQDAIGTSQKIVGSSEPMWYRCMPGIRHQVASLSANCMITSLSCTTELRAFELVSIPSSFGDLSADNGTDLITKAKRLHPTLKHLAPSPSSGIAANAHH